MSILTTFTHPSDIRWQGRQRLHHTIFLAKNILLMPFIILVIVESALIKSWWPYESWEYAPYEFWLRIGLALIPDLVYTIIAFFLILNPMHHSTYSFHPIFALVGSVLTVCLYVQVCWLGPFLAYANEVQFPNEDAWQSIVYAEAGIQVVLLLMWAGMMGLSAVAVHKWRAGKKGGVEEVRV
ncbi:hypothetical protein HBH92_146800 [Parastagonospora nodorum]|nr:hypothetical protein HBH92_146800 [Parastagonospora nodorum]KAH4435697.1 hypothetical protein HBH93_116350 [Parastagonospora nodorum]KAH4447134.1 hypothetical protein HBH91_136510 [Parastagonospora nodorum]KAH4505524.1 hypothetical protein HBH89_085740 [Parastagonospora nodorum]KAH4537195.1 hypothetical protein HBH85_151290 [Parastagonospora nodorum]